MSEEIESDVMNELYSFLQGKFVPKNCLHATDFPKISADEAWQVIYVMQEYFKLLPSKFERCNDCGRLYNSEREGIHTTDGDDFIEGEVGYGLPLEDAGKFLCGYCEDVHRLRETCKQEEEES